MTAIAASRGLVTAELVRRIARGEGSLGRLRGDAELPEDAKQPGKIRKRQPRRIMQIRHGRSCTGRRTEPMDIT